MDDFVTYVIFQTNDFGSVTVIHVGRKDIEVEFDSDKTRIVTDSCQLKRGSIKNQNAIASKWIGKVFETNNYGTVRIVKYINNKTVTVEFEDDGTQVTTSLGCITRGKVKNQNASSANEKAFEYTGKIFDTNKCGRVKVIKYISSKHIEVEFENYDGIVVTTSSHLLSGCVTKPKKLVGQIFETNKCGRAKIIGYTDAEHVEIVFESDDSVAVVSMGNLRAGKVTNHSSNPKAIKYMDNTYKTNSGEKVKVVNYVNSKDITVEFPCGTLAKTNSSNLLAGKVSKLNALRAKTKLAPIYKGQVFETTQCGRVKVIKYIDPSKVEIEFESDCTQTTVTAGNLRKGKAANPNHWKNQYLNKIFESNNYGSFKVVKFVDTDNITIKFVDTGTKVKTTMPLINKGAVKDPRMPSVYGIGFIGQGEYNAVDDAKDYNKWNAMLGRCYSAKVQKKQPSYVGCTVDERWHNFQNYCGDVRQKENYGTSGWDLDKDTIYKRNKVYSDDTTCYLPTDLNGMLVKRKAERGLYYIGVHYNKDLKHPYVAQCGSEDNDRIIGYFDTELEAFEAYKEYKEDLIKKRVRKYKGQIDKRAYKSLMNYEVEMTD